MPRPDSIVDWLRDLLQSRFLRNTAAVVSGNAAAHIVTMIFAPILTRLYGPTAYGLLGAFMAAVAVVTPLAAFAYPTAIVVASDDDEARSLFRLSTRLAVGASIALCVLLAWQGARVRALPGLAPIEPFLLLIPVALFLQSQLLALQQWTIRQRRFSLLAKAALGQSLGINVVRAVGGLLHPSALVLIVLSVLGFASHALLLFKPKSTAGGVALHRASSADLPPLRVVARRYSDFPIYRAPQNFISAVSLALPVLLLAGLVGPASAGFYSIGQTVLGLPAALIGKAVGDVLYPDLAESARAGASIYRPIYRSVAGLALMGLAPFGVVAALGPMLFGYVFGAEWTQAGEYAQWMSLLLFFNFASKPAVAAVSVLGIQRGLLTYEVVSTACKITALIVGFCVFEDDVVAVAAYAVVGALSYVAMVAWVLGVAKRSWR